MEKYYFKNNRDTKIFLVNCFYVTFLFDMKNKQVNFTERHIHGIPRFCLSRFKKHWFI